MKCKTNQGWGRGSLGKHLTRDPSCVFNTGSAGQTQMKLGTTRNTQMDGKKTGEQEKPHLLSGSHFPDTSG